MRNSLIKQSYELCDKDIEDGVSDACCNAMWDVSMCYDRFDCPSMYTKHFQHYREKH